MDTLWILNVLVFVAVMSVGIVPLYIAVRVKVRSFRILSILLGIFAVTHSLYHLANAYNQPILGVVILQPISVTFLFGFGLYYSRQGMR